MEGTRYNPDDPKSRKAYAQEFFGGNVPEQKWEEKFPESPTPRDLGAIGKALDDFLSGQGNRESDLIARELDGFDGEDASHPDIETFFDREFGDTSAIPDKLVSPDDYWKMLQDFESGIEHNGIAVVVQQINDGRINRAIVRKYLEEQKKLSTKLNVARGDVLKSLEQALGGTGNFGPKLHAA